ncbi:MAG: helicase C-terminal domain-containing protein [Planctomycetota bacterium]
MILPSEPPSASLPWGATGGLELAELSFAALWVTGPDPASDAAFRLRALRPDTTGIGGAETFDRFVRLGEGAAPDATARMAREYGVRSADLAAGEPESDAVASWLDFLGRRPVVVADRPAFEAWVARLTGTGEVPMPVLGLPELAAVLTPGRLASEGERLTATLVGGEALARRPRALSPEHVRDALAELVGGVLALPGPVRSLFAHAYADAWGALCEEDPAAADALADALRLAEHPSAWAGGGALFAAGRALEDGRLSAAYDACGELLEALDATRPRWGMTAREDRRREPMPTAIDEARTLGQEDRRTVEEILQELLPRMFTEGGAGNAPSYREGQHVVATEIAESFGNSELLLVHAPTGTGKTLAYLVPAMLWAFRNSVRVGIATYTRALQEQAVDREVPLARELLRRAGVEGDLRVALLKGRENYICWRALKLSAPLRREGATEKLAWATLALFALTDPEGDLNRMPVRPPLALEAPDRWASALRRLLTQTRSQPGCCAHREDREDCAGHASRLRAERSHVVITNHAFALARREFFRHVVFDECEHLHAQAHSAFSFVVPFRALRGLFSALYKPGGSRAPLNRIRAIAVPESEAAACLQRCVDRQEDALATLDELQRAVYRYKLWRDDVAESRQERDLHSIFREYATEEDAADLLSAHGALDAAMTELAVALAEMVEHLDTLPSRGILRVRRTLDILRSDLDDLLSGVTAWLPRTERGDAYFRPETFYDLETNLAGYDVMAARVLLPHEHLGRHYYPDLKGAVLISATTWLGGGFEASARYLGCHRSANPDDDEEREPTPLRTLRAPEAFDYGRVLVAAPRDAPPPSAGKRAALTYLARFVGYLAERSRGRILVLFTNAEDCARAAGFIQPFLAERRIPFWHQRMEGTVKEELAELFRAHVDSVLFGLDTFWFGADFPGETLEYLVLARLPYGVPDRYHHAQCAVLGAQEQRRHIYMPRALAKFRQGFGRLMRKESDRGCVFVLDPRIHDPRHRTFLRELPLRTPDSDEPGAAFVRGDADRCLREAFAHMGMGPDVRRRGLDVSFAGWTLDGGPAAGGGADKVDVPENELPF